MDCIFCKIASGEAPAYKIYEDDEFVAFLDIFPVSRGHVQVIPKEHYRWVWDVPNVGKYFEIGRKIALAQKKVLHTDYVQAFVAGDDVPHAHVWIVPVDQAAGGRIHKDGSYPFNKEEAPELARYLSEALV